VEDKEVSEMARLVRWEPFRDLMSLREAMDRLFEESVVRPREGCMVPWSAGGLAVDMYETEDDVAVKVDLPGMKPEDVDVSVVGNALTIKGEARSEEEVKEENYVRRERRYGAFSRPVPLPTAVNADKATAKYADGILTLEFPKSEEVKPKRIAVKSA
jgi:HSP20 family protein